MEIANKLFKDKMHDIHKMYTRRKKIFTIDNYPIENVKKYKYLGIIINAKKCSFNPNQCTLCN